MKSIRSFICLLLCTWAFVAEGETISLGNIPLLPNTAGQTFTVSVSGGEQTAGMDLYLQIGGGTSGPTITAVNMTTAATIWTAAGIQTPYPGGDSRTALNGVVTASGTVAANGAIAIVTVDTTGISSGTFPISLSVSGNPTDILDNTGTSLSLVLVDGTITVTGDPVTYTVTYHANGASSGTVPAAQTKTHGVDLTLATNSGTLALTGSTFIGWNTQANGLGTDYAVGASYTANAAVVLYAKWTTLPTFTVTYDGNGSTGGSVPVDGAAYLTGANVTVLGPANLVKAGNGFADWNTLADGSGTSYTAATTLVMGSANVTLHAQWTPVSGSTDESGGGGCGSGFGFALLIACWSWFGLSRRRQHAV